MASVKKIEVTIGSSNIFADLNIPNPEEKLTKLRLVVAINKIIEGRRLTQKETAKKLGITQPKISALLNYKLEGFSVERLMHFVTALEHDVVIEIRPRGRAKRPARVTVVNAA